MSDVVDFKHPGPPKEPTLKDKFGYDADFLKWIAEWRAARAQMQKNWAEHDLAAGWGTLRTDGIKLDQKPHELWMSLNTTSQTGNRRQCCSRASSFRWS